MSTTLAMLAPSPAAAPPSRPESGPQDAWRGVFCGSCSVTMAASHPPTLILLDYFGETRVHLCDFCLRGYRALEG